jgi:glycosyltransferase involved in cell wall biosynthesis
MEALACGLPCAVSDIPANREWVTEDVTGWIFPDGDVDALAGIILKAVEHRESLAQISRNARVTAEEKADWPRNFEKLFDAYEQTCRLVKVN